jgi:hypothetical protein
MARPDGGGPRGRAGTAMDKKAAVTWEDVASGWTLADVSGHLSSDYGSRGCRFESCRARKKQQVRGVVPVGAAPSP